MDEEKELWKQIRLQKQKIKQGKDEEKKKMKQKMATYLNGGNRSTTDPKINKNK